MLAAILLLSVGLTVLTGGFSFGSEQADGKTVLATTYPIYVAAQRILGKDTSVALTRLDGAASGCLHDYQLSPSDRRAVQEADLILMNGAGAETFLHGIVDEAKCVDTSAGLNLLCSAHDHDHGGEEHHHEEEYNEHLEDLQKEYKVKYNYKVMFEIP
jgi:zinc transport system substrate-binding protein